MIELYHNDMSVCAQKVRFALGEKALQWKSHHLNLRAGDQQKPEYVKLNPNAVVPTLVDGGSVIIESTVICEYLDDAIRNRRSARAIRSSARACGFGPNSSTKASMLQPERSATLSRFAIRSSPSAPMLCRRCTTKFPTRRNAPRAGKIFTRASTLLILPMPRSASKSC